MNANKLTDISRRAQRIADLISAEIERNDTYLQDLPMCFDVEGDEILNIAKVNGKWCVCWGKEPLANCNIKRKLGSYELIVPLMKLLGEELESFMDTAAELGFKGEK